MNTEIKSIVASLEEVLEGHPWYGRAVFEILNEVAEAKAYTRPAGNSHSLIDLLYHMLTWSTFTKERIEKQPMQDTAEFEATDWRLIDPSVHDWQKGLSALRTSHRTIIELLQTKNDDFLEEKVDYHKYHFRYLLNGLVQHNIYHLGQIAYLSKLLQ